MPDAHFACKCYTDTPLAVKARTIEPAQGSRPGAPQQRAAVQADGRARRERGRADHGGRAQQAARSARPPVRGRGARADCGLAGVAVQHVLAARGADRQGACAPGHPGVTACAAPLP
jgi:hypothetical protein